MGHIDKFSGHESGAFLEIFSKKQFLLFYDITMYDNWNKSCSINGWRVGALRHDIIVNLVCNLFQTSEFMVKRFSRQSKHIFR